MQPGSLKDISYNWLQDQYLVDQRSSVNIAKELNCAVSVVRYHLKKGDIPIRSRKESNSIRWSRDRRSIEYIVKSNGCWDCTSYKWNPQTYFKMHLDGKAVRVHRYVYCMANNVSMESITGLVVMHSCDNPECINPDHLVLGTQTDNVADCVAKGRNVHGERCNLAILTEDNVRAIRKSSKTNIELGRLYGVHRMTINKIRLRQSWRQV